MRELENESGRGVEERKEGCCKEQEQSLAKTGIQLQPWKSPDSCGK